MPAEVDEPKNNDGDSLSDVDIEQNDAANMSQVRSEGQSMLQNC